MTGKGTDEKLDADDSATNFASADGNISFCNSSNVDACPVCFSTRLVTMDVSANCCKRQHLASAHGLAIISNHAIRE